MRHQLAEAGDQQMSWLMLVRLAGDIAFLLKIKIKLLASSALHSAKYIPNSIPRLETMEPYF